MCHTVSRGKLFPFPEERSDFQLPRRYRRDAHTEAQLAARAERLEKQRKAQDYRTSILKEGEEKPIPIARVLPFPPEDSFAQLSITGRQRQLAEIDRKEKPIAIAAVPPEKSTADSNGRMNSNDSERTRVSSSLDDPEAGLDLGDEEDPDLVDWYGPGTTTAFLR